METMRFISEVNELGMEGSTFYVLARQLSIALWKRRFTQYLHSFLCQRHLLCLYCHHLCHTANQRSSPLEQLLPTLCQSHKARSAFYLAGYLESPPTAAFVKRRTRKEIIATSLWQALYSLLICVSIQIVLEIFRGSRSFHFISLLVACKRLTETFF